jgi:hypothetical protein
MINSIEYRNSILKKMIEAAQLEPDILACWEGGSKATDTDDEYSDVDLCLLTNSNPDKILDLIQSAVSDFGIDYTWQSKKSFWGEGLKQRVIVLKNSPRHFCLDIGVFDYSYPDLLSEFLKIERHGLPAIYFDKQNVIKPVHMDLNLVLTGLQQRLEEIKKAFPVFKSLTLKAIDRGQPIDAIWFYQNGLLRPCIEALGMVYRPYRSDFGMRYLHRDFPLDVQKKIESLNYISDFGVLELRVSEVESLFNEAVQIFTDNFKNNQPI